MKSVSARELAAAGLVFVSGAAALSHQIIWTRRLVDILGASADTFSKVVGAFFLGLALGAWVASRKPGDATGAWRRVAWAEVSVAALSLPVLFSIHGIDSLPVRPGPWIKWILPPALVTPPALAIGLVLPWTIRALSTEPGFRSSLLLGFYCLNTLGGVLGIGTVVFVGLPAFGLETAGLIAAGLNIVVAAGAFTLHRLRRTLVPVGKGETASPSQLTGRQKALAFFSGLLVLSLEVLLQHQFAQVTVNSFFSSATVLALVLSTLTVAAVVAPWFLRICGGCKAALQWTLVLSVIACLAQPFLFLWVQPGLRIVPYELTGAPYAWEVMKLGLFVVVPLFFPAGLLFPLLLQYPIGGDGRLIGRQFGLLLAINGAGGWLGAELTQGFVAPTFGLWNGVALLGAVYGLLALFPVCQARKRLNPLKTTWVSGLGMVLLAGAWFGTRELPQVYLERRQRLVELGVSRDGVVATLIDRSNDWRILFNNTYTLGGSKAQFNQERQAHLPLLLHGRAKSVALLGVATGSTVAGAALHADVENIDAIELCGLVLEYADRHFTPFNRGVFRDLRARMIHEDARWWIAGCEHLYDVVIGDLFLPWRTGEGRLFSREHFRAVRRSLKSDGIFCQWLPLFQLTRPQYDVIVRTFRDVFPEAYLIRGDFYTELPIVGLVGGRALSAQPWELTAQACARLRLAGDVTDALVRHPEGVAMMVVGPLPDPGPGPENSLGNAWLEWNAGRNIPGMKTPWFIGVPCAEYVRDIQRASQFLLPNHLRDAHDAGQFFLTLEVAAKLDLPVLVELKAQVSQRTPAVLRQDTAADWQQWPMRLKPEFNVNP